MIGPIVYNSARIQRTQLVSENNGFPNSPVRIGNSLKLPYIDEAVVNHLEEVYPDSLRLVPKMGSLEAAQGARDVIEHLKSLLKEQETKPE